MSDSRDKATASLEADAQLPPPKKRKLEVTQVGTVSESRALVGTPKAQRRSNVSVLVGVSVRVLVCLWQHSSRFTFRRHLTSEREDFNNIVSPACVSCCVCA